MEKYKVSDCKVIELDKHHSDRKGNLTVVENGNTIPFNVKRAYYLYDIPGGEARGAHAHKELEQLIIAASGSFRVTLDDGESKSSFFLNRPYQGLWVRPGLWRDLDDFSSGAICLVLANQKYDEKDYVRNYNEFLHYLSHQRQNNDLTLVEFDHCFLDYSFNWLQDKEIQALVGCKPFSKEEQEQWYTGLYGRNDYKIYGINCGAVPIGACGIKKICSNNGEIFCYIGDKKYWGGNGTTLLRLIEAEAYKLHLKKLCLQVLSTNKRAINLYLKCGYVIKKADNSNLYMEKEL